MSAVVLAYMPFAPIERPSIALGILKATLAETTLSCATIHANLRFAEEAGLRAYEVVGNRYEFSDLIGDWIFSGVAFPDFGVDQEAYFRKVFASRLSVGSVGQALADAEVERICRELRALAAGFVDRLAREIVSLGPLIVGCSSAFEQHTASLGLLRRIKELSPAVVTMLGGANCESEMGEVTHRRARWVDFVVSGEAEDVFPWLCRRIHEKGPLIPAAELPAGVAGPAHRELGDFRLGRAMLTDLDRSPVPDYHEYFASLRASAIRRFIVPGLPVETSRGCWWGQTRHCKFCGLNGAGMAYRAKSAPRVLKEFGELAESHGLRKFEVVDNILDMRHFDSLLPELARFDPAYSIFYETKSNLTEPHLALMARAGVRWIQPGIESLHTGILRLLDKGNTASINIELLKWARIHGVRVSWNMLCDLPGDEDAWYEEMAAIMPGLHHLDAPQGLSGIQFVRFSPYQQDPSRYGLNLVPNSFCSHVYPWEPAEIARFAYVFEDRGGATREPAARVEEFTRPAHQRVQRQVLAWQAAGESVTLHREPSGEDMVVIDTRPCALEERTRLSRVQQHVLDTCVRARARVAVETNVTAAFGLTPDETRDVIAGLQKLAFLLEIEGRLLSLVLDRAPAGPRLSREQFPGGYVSSDYSALRGLLRQIASASVG